MRSSRCWSCRRWNFRLKKIIVVLLFCLLDDCIVSGNSGRFELVSDVIKEMNFLCTCVEVRVITGRIW